MVAGSEGGVSSFPSRNAHLQNRSVTKNIGHHRIPECPVQTPSPPLSSSVIGHDNPLAQDGIIIEQGLHVSPSKKSVRLSDGAPAPLRIQ